MFRQYLKIAIRNIGKNKGFSLINVIGLSLGLASMMTLVMLVYQYYTTDEFLVNRDRMYYLKSYMPDGYSMQQTTFPLLYEIQKAAPEVEAATHTLGWYAPWLNHMEAEVQENTLFVDTGFFEVFSFPLLEGNADLALKEKHSVVISQKVARQLFGNEKALGKIITASDSINLTVTGVLDEIPVNSSIKADVLLPMELLLDNEEFREGANWYNTFAVNYLLLREGADPELLDRKIDKIVKQYYAPESRESQVKTVPFDHLKKEAGPVIGSIITGAMISAAFIVLVMLANLLNLNTALVFSRTKEVAIRRMIGSGRRSIILQFCIENALVVTFSLLLSIYLFTQILLPQVNKVIGGGFGQLQFNWLQDLGLIMLFVLIAALIALLAGGVPALYATSIKVSEAVKGKIINADGRGWLRRTFITIQFTLAVVLIGVALVLNSQIRFMKEASLGFNTENVAVVNLDLAFKDGEQAESRFESILNELKNNPYVKSVATTQVIPTAYWSNYNNYIDVESGKEVHFRHASSGAGFAETFQIPLVEGRYFDDQLAASESTSVVINQAAVKAFGWTNPIGKKIKGKGMDDEEAGTVVGVMEDFHYTDLQQSIEPLLHWYGGKQSLGYNSFLSIRLQPHHSQQVLAGLEQDFKTMPSRRSFSYTFMEERVEEQYALLDGLLKVTNYVALLTIMIATMGMFGLVTLFARQRVKEIGIRKVLGASVLNITALLTKDFVKLVVLAIIIATPVAWYLMHQWLQDFAYRINISWWMFAGAGLLALLIALATISVQAIKAARANPVDNLRTE